MSDDMNIFAFASTSTGVSPMSNCPPNDSIAGVSLNTCLSGLFDNSLLGFWESHPEATIGEIVDFVVDDVGRVSQQHPVQFGDLSIREMQFSDFVGVIPIGRRIGNAIANSNNAIILIDYPNFQSTSTSNSPVNHFVNKHTHCKTHSSSINNL